MHLFTDLFRKSSDVKHSAIGYTKTQFICICMRKLVCSFRTRIIQSNNVFVRLFRWRDWRGIEWDVFLTHPHNTKGVTQTLFSDKFMYLSKLFYMLCFITLTLGKKATIYQITTMLATSKNVLIPGNITTCKTQVGPTDDPTLWLLPEHQRVKDHQCRWLAGGYDLEIGHF